MPNMPFNWVDWLSLAIVLFSLLEGWRLGFVHLISSFLAYAAAAYLSMRFYSPVGVWITQLFGISRSWTDVLGFVIIIIFSLIVFTSFFIFLTEKLIRRILFTIADRICGVIIAICNAFIILFFLFVAVSAMPDAVKIKEGVSDSWIAPKILAFTDKFGNANVQTLKNTIAKNIRFITIDPNSSQSVVLPVSVERWSLFESAVDASSMLARINAERKNVGAQDLILDKELSKIAVSYSRDMFERRYFSHTSPDGKSLKDRLKEARIAYMKAAENLAYAPDIALAHKGLMNSLEHRVNILEPLFTRVGIGVIDSGSSGIIGTQIFIR
jgi:uncharacterized protein YkwD